MEGDNKVIELSESAEPDFVLATVLACGEHIDDWEFKRAFQEERKENRDRVAGLPRPGFSDAIAVETKVARMQLKEEFTFQDNFLRERAEKKYFQDRCEELQADVIELEVRCEKRKEKLVRRSRRLAEARKQIDVLAANLLVSLNWIRADPFEVACASNYFDGPRVLLDYERGGHGLFAEKDYAEGDIITTYGGFVSYKPINGDYVAKCNEAFIDGEYNFYLQQKGRWINESDRERKVVNCVLGRVVRATCTVLQGEQFFCDYGKDYNRNY